MQTGCCTLLTSEATSVDGWGRGQTPALPLVRLKQTICSGRGCGEHTFRLDSTAEVVIFQTQRSDPISLYMAWNTFIHGYKHFPPPPSMQATIICFKSYSMAGLQLGFTSLFKQAELCGAHWTFDLTFCSKKSPWSSVCLINKFHLRCPNTNPGESCSSPQPLVIPSPGAAPLLGDLH